MGQLQNYKRTRVRGFAPYEPTAKTRLVLDQVNEVLAEYEEHLPLTIRQVFYRLVGKYGYTKTDNAYKALADYLGRARRAEMIPFASLRDDGPTIRKRAYFTGLKDFQAGVRLAAERYQRSPLEGQAAYVEVWCEAEGMVPQVYRVAEPFGAMVVSSGGFDSLTLKHDTACRFAGRRDRQTIVLHIGDLDPSGHSIFDSLADDVQQLAAGISDAPVPEFRRVVITPAQAMHLPSAPAKTTDKRGDFTGGTVQAEALAPDVLAAELRAALEVVTDADVRERIAAESEAEKKHVLAWLEAL